MESWSFAMEEGGGILFSDYGMELNTSFSHHDQNNHDKNTIIFPDYEEINGEAELMELWTNNNNNNFIFTNKIASCDNNNVNNKNNNNNWKRIPPIMDSKIEHIGKDKIITNFDSLSQLVPICQVDGCNVDLRSSKYYHQRHRVCVDHSKTSKATLHGVDQRFCQQCSRFHELAEFDDDKRSCRKRLACHNERRRKPRFHTQWGGSPFLFPEIMSGNYNFAQEQENNNNNRQHFNFLSSQNALAGNLLEMLSAAPNFPGGDGGGSGAYSLLSPHTEKDQNTLGNNLSIISNDAPMMEGNFGISKNNNSKGLKFSPEITSGPTIDLQQLSTNLQRVEQLRNSTQDNQGLIMFNNNIF